jgi:hypothetical protein
MSFNHPDFHATLEIEWRVSIQPPPSDLAFVIARRQQHLSELAIAVINNSPVFGQLT